MSRGLPFIYRELESNRLAGIIPAQVSALVNLQLLWALSSCLISVGQILLAFQFSMSVVLVHLSLSLSRVVGQVFIECWSCAPSLSCCYFRDLHSNQIAGTIPAVISTLVRLRDLWALASFYLIKTEHLIVLASSMSAGHIHLSLSLSSAPCMHT